MCFSTKNRFEYLLCRVRSHRPFRSRRPSTAVELLHWVRRISKTHIYCSDEHFNNGHRYAYRKGDRDLLTKDTRMTRMSINNIITEKTNVLVYS